MFDFKALSFPIAISLSLLTSQIKALASPALFYSVNSPDSMTITSCRSQAFRSLDSVLGNSSYAEIGDAIDGYTDSTHASIFCVTVNNSVVVTIVVASVSDGSEAISIHNQLRRAMLGLDRR